MVLETKAALETESLEYRAQVDVMIEEGEKRKREFLVEDSENKKHTGKVSELVRLAFMPGSFLKLRKELEKKRLSDKTLQKMYTEDFGLIIMDSVFYDVLLGQAFEFAEIGRICIYGSLIYYVASGVW